ncbi:MAG: hypothetical protein Q9159_000864 [Coniocarpon cinnabarinum]
MATSTVSASSFNTDVEHLDSSSFKDEESRRAALDAARSLVRRLEKPMESMLRMCWVEPSHAFALKTAVDLKLFEVLGRDGKDSEKSVRELADATNADPILVHRLCRLLAAMDTIREVDEGVFAPNALSLANMNRPVSAAIDFLWDISAPPFQTYPRYLKETGYRNPTKNDDGPWQMAMQTKLTHFDWVAQHPHMMHNFGEHMAGYTSQRGTWDSIYPVQSHLLTPPPADPPSSASPSADDIVLIDIGGGSGHDLLRFATAFLPNTTTPRLILQDLPNVTAQFTNSSLPPSIKTMPHNFFEEQPVKGARGYYLHSVLHDWPDEDAKKILKALRPALSVPTAGGGQSKLLINENVIPAKNCPAQAAALDLMMSAYHAARERSEGEWRALLEGSGYKVTGVFTGRGVDEGVVEAVVDETWKGDVVVNGAK